MKKLMQVLLFGFAFIALPLAHAQSETLVCDSGAGMTPTLPLYAINVDIEGAALSATPTITVFANLSAFPYMVAAEAAQTTYSKCTISIGPVSFSFSGATVQLVEGTAVVPGIANATGVFFASATFFYSSITSDGVTVTTPASANTAEARAKAIAAIRARATPTYGPQPNSAQ